MSVRVIARVNPFSDKRTEELFEQGLTIKQIIEKLNIDIDKNQVRVLVQDEKELDFERIPEEDDLVLINVIPSGENPFQVVGDILVGVAFIAGGALITIGTAGLGALVGLPLMAFGLNNIVSGVYNAFGAEFPEELLTAQDYTNPTLADKNYLSGGTNSLSADSPVPVILGRHRYYPHLVALPYSELIPAFRFPVTWNITDDVFATSFTQEVHQMYLWGHKEVIPETGTYKRGETDISTLTGTNYSENSTEYYGDKAKKFINIGKTLKPYKRDASNSNAGFTEIEVILPAKTASIKPTLLFGSFYAIRGEGSDSVSIAGRAAVKSTLFEVDGATETEVYTRTDIIRGPVTPLGGTQQPVSYTLDIDYAMDSTKLYNLKVLRLNDNMMENPFPYTFSNPSLTYNRNVTSFASACSFSYVLCEADLDTISTEADNLFNYVDVFITDEAKEEDGKTSVITGEINDFNAIVQTHIPVYNGTGTGSTAWTTVEPSSNPAALFLYVLQGSPNKRPISNDLVDWEALEEWYEFCETEGFECNLVLNNPGTVESILNTICETGRAAFDMTSLYSVIVDQPRLAPTQMFTNKNSYGMKNTRNLINDVHAVEYTFIDETDDVYESSVYTVYREGYSEDGSGGTEIATLKQAGTFIGITDGEQIRKLGRYKLNCLSRRLETMSVSMDIEYVLCKRGDVVSTSYDELLTGLVSGRIREVIKVGTDITQLVLDEEVTLEVGKSYGVIVRISDAQQTTSLTLEPVLVETTTKTITLETPIDEGIGIEVGNLYTVGESTNETEDFIVLSVAPGQDFTATVLMAPYAPEVYNTSGMDPFVSTVTKPANFGSSITLSEVYNVDDTVLTVAGEVNQINTVVTPSLRSAIKAGIPSANLIRQDALEVKLSNNYLYFIDKEDLKVYRATTLVSGATELIIDGAVKEFDVAPDDSFIVYSDLLDSNKLYHKDLVTTTVTLIADTICTQPSLVGDGTVAYINRSDFSKVYLTDFTDDTVGEVILDFTATSMSVKNNFIIWMDPETNNILIKDIQDSTPTYKGESYTVLSATNLLATDPALWLDTSTTVTPVYVDANTQMSYINNEAYYGNVSRHAMDSNGNYVFVTSDGYTYFVSLLVEETQARLDVETVVQGFGTDIRCTTTTGSNKLTDISTEDIDVFTIGDTLTGTGIPAGTKVLLVGSGFVEMDNEATLTVTNNPVNVAGAVTCSIVENDTRIRNIPVDAIGKFAWNDSITGNGIPEDTTVTFVGSTFITISQPATLTDETATINVFGTRLLLDANKVIVTGSIQARLLETNAINSIDRVGAGLPNEGEQLYQHNLSTGTEKQYNNAGELIRQFTPEDGLWLREGIKIGGTAPGEGTTVPSDPSFTDTTYTTYRQATEPTGGTYIVGDQWYNTSTGLFSSYVSGGTWEPIIYTPTQLDDLNIDAGTINDGLEVNETVPSGALFTDTTNTIYRLPTNTPPASPIENDQWFRTDTNLLYKYTGSTWDLIGPASLGDLDGTADTKLNNIQEGATQNNIFTAVTVGDLPATALDGDLAIVTDVDDLYKWQSTTWVKISDATPGYLNNGGAVGYDGGSGTSWELDSAGKLTARGATLQATSSNGLTTTVIDDGSIEFFQRDIATDPWTSIGVMEGGVNNGNPILKTPQDFLMGVVTLGRGTNSLDSNIAMGEQALESITTGGNNTGLGRFALKNNTTGFNNTAIGGGALQLNTTGYSNVAVGQGTLGDNTTGYDNVAIGEYTLWENTSGNRNIAIGSAPLRYNTIGVNNTALGDGALGTNTEGNENVAIGRSALQENLTGNNNVGIGYLSVGFNETGYENTGIGYNALRGNVTGSKNTALGSLASLNLANYTNTTTLGYYALVTGSNQVQLGNSSTTTYAYGAVQNRSDRRDKADIVNTDLGLAFINALNPVKFKWDYREDYRTVIDGEINEEDKDGSKKRSRYHQGFIAQDVKKVMDTLGIDFAGYQDHSISDGEDVLSLGYEEFIAPMVKAIQELSAKVTELEAKN